MRKLQLDWEGYFPLDERTIRDRVKDASGVFKISVEEKDGHLKPVLIGEDASLRRRLKEEVVPKEPTCARKKAEDGKCMFKFAYLHEKSERDAAFRALYVRYRPSCNEEAAIPEAEEVEVNTN